jgi:putative radical SAM enzyme (TIGR03279 family)
MHEISEVCGIAQELEIEPGDILLQINGREILDVFDYKFTVMAEDLLLEIQKPCGEIWELEIEKDADEDLGLSFVQPLMSAKRACRNKCIFCFVDQQPRGLRPSLYFKDDDARLSFLHGNYVTLTNLSEAEIKRLAGYHLSPLRISVHAADLDLRKKMMGTEAAGNLFSALQIFADAGIKMHFQVVLCKGVNDDDQLSHTISVLAAQKGAESLAIVPAGISRHRNGLYPLEQFTAEEARRVIYEIQKYPKNFVFAADEWYIIAKENLPPYEYYADFPQLDNGVGMLRLFENEFMSARTNANVPTKNIAIVTGLAAAEFMRGIAAAFMNAHPAANVTVHPVENHFFGENITVSGLLAGKDIIAQINVCADVIFIPENAFRVNTETMLDGTTLAELSSALGVPVQIGSTNGKNFYNQMIGVKGTASPCGVRGGASRS